MLFSEQLSSFSEQLFGILRAQSGHAYSPLRNDPQTGNYKRIYGRGFLKQITLRINVINLSK
jgi:hypothetical protein